MESFEQRSQQRKAVDSARRYRDAEQRIRDQIRSIENQAKTDANKREIRRLTRLAEQKNVRASHYEQLAREIAS